MKQKDEMHENETNSLRRWMDHIRLQMQGRGLYFVVGTLVLVVAAVVLFRYWRISQANASSARWLELYIVDSEKGLETIITSPANQGKPQVVFARLQKARLALYTDGINRLGSSTPADRDAAIEKVEEGRKRYEEIAADLSNTAALQQEAFFSLARAEECLIARPKKDGTGDRGSVDKAIAFWRKAADINPESEPGKRYAAQADSLKKNKEQIRDFYARMVELGFTPALPRDEFHGFGPSK